MAGAIIGVLALVAVVGSAIWAAMRDVVPEPPPTPPPPPPEDKPADGSERKPAIPPKLGDLVNKIGDWILLDPHEADPAPDPRTPADPLHPATKPTPGKYFQCKQGVWGSEIALQAYHGDHPTKDWEDRIVPCSLNQWIAYDVSKGWGGSILPKYSGWNTPFGSGHLFPVIYIPV